MYVNQGENNMKSLKSLTTLVTTFVVVLLINPQLRAEEVDYSYVLMVRDNPTIGNNVFLSGEKVTAQDDVVASFSSKLATTIFTRTGWLLGPTPFGEEVLVKINGQLVQLTCPDTGGWNSTPAGGCIRN